MKKILNINFSGRIIPIEDTAYESLQRYIDSLRKYFINEEGRDEIINDIESRIAELMNEKIKKGSTAITDGDMDLILKSMGRVEDFEQTETGDTAHGTEGAKYAFTDATSKRFSGRLYRDEQDKILGGVCSGIAHYFHVDPAIIRLLFALLVFGAGSGILLYILLWIILPARPMGDTVKPLGKRFFRNPDDKIIGGVAGGLAAYFNKEAWVFRLIFGAPLLLNIVFGILNGIFSVFHMDIFPNFFIGSFTGTFFITYIILWIVLPEAKTPYDKMEMRGENIDVNTIKQNVQEGMGDFKSRMQSWGEEVKSSAQNLSDKAKTFASDKGKNFSFEVKETAKPIGAGIGRIIGILFKAFFIFIAGTIAFALFVVLIVFIFGGGFAAGPIKQNFLGFILDGFWQHAFFWGTLVFFFVVPVIGFFTWLVRRILKIKSRKHYLGYVFGGLWTLGWISISLLVSSVAMDFRRGDTVELPVEMMQPAGDKLIVAVNEPAIEYTGDLWFIEDENGGWDITADSLKLTDVKIHIVKSETDQYSTTIQKYSRGKTRSAALANAGLIQYNALSRDSLLDLGNGISISKKNKYRGQKIIVEISVPVGKKILFDETVQDKLNPFHVSFDKNKKNRRNRRNTDFEWDNFDYFNWKPGVEYIMTEAGTLQRVDTPVDSSTNGITAPQIDSIQNVIDEKERQIEREKERLEILKQEKDARSTQLHKSKNNFIPASLPFIPTIL